MEKEKIRQLNQRNGENGGKGEAIESTGNSLTITEIKKKKK